MRQNDRSRPGGWRQDHFREHGSTPNSRTASALTQISDAAGRKAITPGSGARRRHSGAEWLQQGHRAGDEGVDLDGAAKQYGRLDHGVLLFCANGTASPHRAAVSAPELTQPGDQAERPADAVLGLLHLRDHEHASDVRLRSGRLRPRGPHPGGQIEQPRQAGGREGAGKREQGHSRDGEDSSVRKANRGKVGRVADKFLNIGPGGQYDDSRDHLSV